MCSETSLNLFRWVYLKIRYTHKNGYLDEEHVTHQFTDTNPYHVFRQKKEYVHNGKPFIASLQKHHLLPGEKRDPSQKHSDGQLVANQGLLELPTGTDGDILVCLNLFPWC